MPTALLPRIYYVHSWAISPKSQWSQYLDYIQTLGFDHLLIAPPFAIEAQGSVFATADHARFQDGRTAEEALNALAQECRQRGLRLLMDVVLDRVAGSHPLVKQHPELFDRAGDAALDPRASFDAHGLAEARFTADARDQLSEWASGLLTRWTAAGVAGFRCLAPQKLPAALWRRLRGENPDSLFLAWTPGLSQSEVVGLAGCGFDFGFSSVRWWDGKASWLVEEHEAYRPVFPLIAFPEEPFGRRLSASVQDRAVLQATYRHALELAVATGSGLMVPMGFEQGAPHRLEAGAAPVETPPTFDLSAEIKAANARLAQLGIAEGLCALTGPDAKATALIRRTGSHHTLILINPDLSRNATVDTRFLTGAVDGATRFQEPGDSLEMLYPGASVRPLAPGEIRLLGAIGMPPILAEKKPPKPKTLPAVDADRLIFANVTPSLEQGRFAVKRCIGDLVVVEADIICDGHDKLAARLLWRTSDKQEWHAVPMLPLGNDRWRAPLPLSRIGRHIFTIEAWFDAYGSWRDEVQKKRAAGRNLTLEIEEGRLLFTRWAADATGDRAKHLKALLAHITKLSEQDRLEFLISDEVAEIATLVDPRRFCVRLDWDQPLDAEPADARFSSWYELFPRSITNDARRHGTFRDVIGRLPAVRAMGFDVLYFPPIHPIGKTNRKGRNNSLTPTDSDPGSPYAIGASEGGHDAVHPDLGTLADFQALVQTAKVHGLEIALDFAIQCSPDHPWLKDHPDWFAWRPDGSMKYAENPPKRYEDIVNVDFYAEGAKPALWLALRDVVLFWVKQDVRLFRVDNPHTKPFPFWEWLIADVRGRQPDVLFLAEAFTRPRIMEHLAKLGFSQSYTYFTWRNTKRELTDYFTELNQTPVADYFRPHCFVNTPDINPTYLHNSGRPGFLVRAALAATLSGLWGVYSGFELCESAPLKGKEEYLDSEKYEVKPRDWRAPGNIIAEITALNRIRKANPALQTHLGVKFYNAFNDQILYFAKATPNRDNVILVAVNLDPHAVQEAEIEVPLWEWKLPDHAAMAVQDLIGGNSFIWQGKIQRVRLDPQVLPYAIWRIHPVIEQPS
jgi:starch synthase (maltosyl-transferring)